MKSKEKFPIGIFVKGTIRYFYPQGIIFDINDVQGCGNYDSCKTNSLPSALYPNNTIFGTVKGYDDINMWLLIDNCKAE